MDLEDANKAARSRRELKFYIDGDHVVRRVFRQRTVDSPGPSVDLAKRAAVIAQVLAGDLAGLEAREALAAVPDVFTAIP